MKFINASKTLENSLISAGNAAESLLKKLAIDQRFAEVMTTAFEPNFDQNKLEYLRQAWAVGDFSTLPEVEIRSSQEINLGAGAFSKNTNKIYIAEEFASLHRHHTLAIADILLEETGHWVDAQINAEEAPGDEGAIFSALVRGKILNPQQLQELKAENDHATVILDGEEIEIEQAIVSFTGEIEAVDISNLWANDATTHSAYKYSDWFAQTSNSLQIFQESEDVFLAEDISISDPDNWDSLVDLEIIPAGTTVNTYFIFFKNPTPGETISATAEIVFDETVLGFQGDPALINPTNDLFLPFDARPLSNAGTLEVTKDTVAISGDSGNILQVSFGNTSAVDPLRVITYTPIPDTPPEAVNDSYSTVVNTALTFDVTSNDTDINGDQLTISSYDTSATVGNLTLNADGSFSYTPATDFTGTDSFSYTVSDGNNGVDTATVYLNVLAQQNLDPIQIEAEDMALKNYVIRNRSFASGGQLIRLRHRNNYRDNNDRVGTATAIWEGEAGLYDIEVVYHDESDGTATAEINVDNTPIESWVFDENPGNANPNVNNRVERTLTKPVNLYPESTIELSSWIDEGENDWGGKNGWIDYIKLTPRETDIIRIEAEDMTLKNYAVRDRSFASGGQLIRYLINNKDEAGTATTIWTREAGTYIVQVAYHDENDGNAPMKLEVDGDLVDSWVFDENPGNANPNVNNRVERTLKKTVTLSPGSTIELTGWRNGGENAWIDHIQFIPLVAPEAVDDSYSVAEDNSLTVTVDTGVLSNDIDNNGGNLTVSDSDSTSTEGGTVNLNNDGSFSYTPPENFIGNDSFGYTVSDEYGQTKTATVTVEVTPENDAPEAVDDNYSVFKDSELTFDAVSNDSDVDGDLFMVNGYDSASTAGGTVSFNNNDNTFTYIPTIGFTGIDSFTYTIDDGNGGIDTATVTLDVNTGPIRIEAEDLDLDNYSQEDGDYASNGQLIKIGDNDDRGIGTASYTWTGSAGNYDLVVAYYDETDGKSTAKVSVDGVEIGDWTFHGTSGGSRPNPNNLVERTINLDLDANSTIVIEGTRNSGENARLDYIELTSIEVDETAPTATLTAETLNIGSDTAVSYNFDVTFSDESGVEINSLDHNDILVTGPNGFSQTATLISTNGNGGVPQSATYQIQAPNGGWQDDHFGAYAVTVNGNEVSDTEGNFMAETMIGNFQVNVGENMSYAFSDEAVIVRLDQDLVFTPEFEDTLEIMLLGDSITQGKVNDLEPEENREGYRRFLWDALDGFGLDVDFVGSESHGTGGFDQDHQGHPGWNINQIAFGKNGVGGVDEWIPAANPDLVVMMIGTNDSGGSAETMIAALGNNYRLIDKVFDHLSDDAELIVSTIAPIHPDSAYYDSRLPNVLEYNSLIPGVVEDYVNQGENIHFVDIWSGETPITEDEMTAPPDDNGLHPSVNGYENIAQTFYNAILDAVGITEAISNVGNVVGSTADDVIVGNDSSNEIVGGTGRDELTGNDGADLFIYTAITEGEDILTDFDRTDGDKIQLSASGFAGGLQGGVSLSDGVAADTGVFVTGSNPQSVGDSINILYDTATGVLSVDIDGTGNENPVTLATLTGIPTLMVDDLMIV